MPVVEQVDLDIIFHLQRQEVYQLEQQVILFQLVEVVLLNQHQTQVEVEEVVQDLIQFLQDQQLLHQPEVAVEVVLP